MRRRILWLLFIVLCAVSCTKEAGDGGLATIQGHVYENLYDPSGGFLEQIPAATENVYLIYGDNTTYDDRVDTDADGKYEFKGLQKGEYRVFAFSDCNTCSSGSIEVGVDVEISDKKGTTAAADISVTKNLDYNDGTGSIQGLIVELEYTTDTPIVVSASYNKPNENVYIVYGSDPAYFDRVDTDGSGLFRFTGLLMGPYRVFAFSDCENCQSGTEEKDASVTISTNGEAVDVGTITIEKR